MRRSLTHLGYNRIIHPVGKWVCEPLKHYFSSSPSTLQESGKETADISLGYSTLTLPDGATLAYEILGSHLLGKSIPLVMICGMTAIRNDAERVTGVLANSHPVLLYDHRGMGNSTQSPVGNEGITIELLARDLLYLIAHLKWEEVALCGHSMGGVIAQQLLVLPRHATNPTPLPFRTTHLFLIGTRCKAQSAVGLPLNAVPGKPRSLEERREGAQRVLAATLDSSWIEANSTRFEQLFEKVINNNLSNRPAETIAQQRVALKNFCFEGLLRNLPGTTQVMVIHGSLDQVIPYQCSEDILSLIPHAKALEEGRKPGQVPTLSFGHLWYEYFEPQVWHDVLHIFMQKKFDSAGLVNQKKQSVSA